MKRWMIGTAVLGALTGPAHGQVGGGQDRQSVEVHGDVVIVAQAPAQPKPAPVPAPPKTVPPAPPTPTAPLPAPPKPPENVLFEARPPKLEKITYLGAVTSSAPAAMREQLKLAQGVGLVVDRVEPGTPAEQAGVKQHDVLERLDDQLLVNPEQLATLLRSKKPGDEVTLAIVRQGQRQSIKAKLAEKEVDTNAFRLVTTADFAPGKGLIVGDHLPAHVTAERITLPMKLDMANGGPIVVGGKNVSVRTMGDGAQTTVWADDEVSISIERRGDKTAKIVVKDKKTDQTLHSGTEEGLDKLFEARPELREKMKKAEDAARRDPVQLRFAPPLPPATIKGGAAFGGWGGGTSRVVKWQDNDHVLIVRMAGRTPTYLLALSKKDGRTIFDGPVANEDDRRSVPAEVAEEFQLVADQPQLAEELGAPVKATTVAPAAAGGGGGGGGGGSINVPRKR